MCQSLACPPDLRALAPCASDPPQRSHLQKSAVTSLKFSMALRGVGGAARVALPPPTAPSRTRPPDKCRVASHSRPHPALCSMYGIVLAVCALCVRRSSAKKQSRSSRLSAQNARFLPPATAWRLRSWPAPVLASSPGLASHTSVRRPRRCPRARLTLARAASLCRPRYATLWTTFSRSRLVTTMFAANAVPKRLKAPAAPNRHVRYVARRRRSFLHLRRRQRRPRSSSRWTATLVSQSCPGSLGRKQRRRGRKEPRREQRGCQRSSQWLRRLERVNRVNSQWLHRLWPHRWHRRPRSLPLRPSTRSGLPPSLPPRLPPRLPQPLTPALVGVSALFGHLHRESTRSRRPSTVPARVLPPQ